MSLPVGKVVGKDDDNEEEVPLRHAVYDLLIDKYLDESSCMALAISEELDGFSSYYTMSRYKPSEKYLS